MRNLLYFLLRYSAWLLFGLYVVLSCVMLFNTNPYQHYVYLTSAGNVASTVYGVANNVTSYFALRDINDDLQRRNAELEMEVLSLRDAIARRDEMLMRDTMSVDSALFRYRFIIARVINNSINRPHNYITIMKGERDGIRPEMGVVDQNGIVGIVNVVGPHTARVISLLNPNLRLSCKVKKSEHVGSLVWDGKDPHTARLEELPRHATFEKGDTIVTSGYSSVFPADLPVGRVIGIDADADANFFALRVELFTDFSTLSMVRVIDDGLAAELKVVEKDPDGED
ncbi:MAG: rod shape-determining protein MreC [Muribaculaceae bacterium]|nr:rod shape-determining protein MreC [Muribaculaceae bacterium]